MLHRIGTFILKEINSTKFTQLPPPEASPCDNRQAESNRPPKTGGPGTAPSKRDSRSCKRDVKKNFIVSLSIIFLSPFYLILRKKFKSRVTWIPSPTDLTSAGTVRSVACIVGVVVEIIGNKRSAKMTRNGYIFQFLQDFSGSQLPDRAVPCGSGSTALRLSAPVWLVIRGCFGMQAHSFKSTFPSGPVLDKTKGIG